VIVISAMLLSDLRGGERPGAKAVAKTVLIAAIPIALVAAEPDLGVMIVLVLLVAGLIALSGVRLRWVAGMAGRAGLAVTAVAKLHLLKAYQVRRLASFINPSADPRGTGYSAAQAKIAIGSGGLHGTGLFHSSLIAGSFVPEQHTDFIFAVVGNELGFVGSMIIIGLLALLLLAAPDADAAERQVRRAGRGGVRDMVRRAVVRQSGDDDGNHARDRPAAAVRLVRRLGNVRRHDRGGPASVGASPAQRLLELTIQ